MVVRSDALDRTQRPRSEARTRTVGDAKIHGDADDRDLQIAEIGLVRINSHVRRRQEGRDAGVRRKPRSALVEDLVGNLAEGGVEQLAAMAFAILCLQFGKLVVVPGHRFNPPSSIA
ncbi:hypothetical protein D3C71_1873420 [compost metagenome]